MKRNEDELSHGAVDRRGEGAGPVRGTRGRAQCVRPVMRSFIRHSFSSYGATFFLSCVVFCFRFAFLFASAYWSVWQGNQKNPDELCMTVICCPPRCCCCCCFYNFVHTAAAGMQKRRGNKVIFEVNCVKQEMPNVILINTKITAAGYCWYLQKQPKGRGGDKVKGKEGQKRTLIFDIDQWLQGNFILGQGRLNYDNLSQIC